MIGTDVQNTTLPDKKAAKAMPASMKRDFLKMVVVDRLKKKPNDGK
ncbi:MAG: hypothetical protein RLZZ53_1001 [Acidobacteriota bacterium]|jgi:hypothetical protein